LVRLRTLRGSVVGDPGGDSPGQEALSGRRLRRAVIFGASGTPTTRPAPASLLEKARELEVHRVRGRPQPSPAEAPVFEGRDHSRVLVVGPALRVCQTVDVDRDAPGVVREAPAGVAVDETGLVTVPGMQPVLRDIDKLGQDLLLDLGQCPGELADHELVAGDRTQDRDGPGDD